jgi:hypothetical protein
MPQEKDSALTKVLDLLGLTGVHPAEGNEHLIESFATRWPGMSMSDPKWYLNYSLYRQRRMATGYLDIPITEQYPPTDDHSDNSLTNCDWTLDFGVIHVPKSKVQSQFVNELSEWSSVGGYCSVMGISRCHSAFRSSCHIDTARYGYWISGYPHYRAVSTNG